MKGDFQARFRENLRVKLPWVTRLAEALRITKTERVNFENKDKAILWAHNMHIANSPGKLTPTGFHLKNGFGEKYYSFGF